MKANWQVTKVMGIGRNQQVCSVEVNSESVEQGVKVRVQGAKVRASISASRCGMQQQHVSTTTTTSDRIGPAQHDAAISATCMWARFVEEMGALADGAE